MKVAFPQRLERRVIYESEYICLYTDRVLLPDGKMIEKYHQLHYPKEAVCVVIFNQKQEIMMVHNRRYTIGRLEWEVPAGRVEPGEAIYQAASRECGEETGCTLKELTFLCSQNPSNGMSDAVCHIFAATVEAENAILDKNEIADKRWFSQDQVLDMLKKNETKDGISMLAILYALQFYSGVKGK